MVNELELAYVTPIDDAEVLGEIKDTLGDEKNLSPYRSIQVSKFVMGSYGVRMTHQRHYYDLDSLTSVLFELSLHYTIFGVSRRRGRAVEDIEGGRGCVSNTYWIW